MLPYLDEYLEKAGFGSHGGRVIGFTPSAKPIYQSSQLAGSAALHTRLQAKNPKKGDSHAQAMHSQHFSQHSAGDHHAAAAAHSQAASSASARGSSDSAAHHTHMAGMHTKMASMAGSRSSAGAMAHAA